ncbi:MAG: class I SAM-dependent methyltransferase, partial [Pricia sp.]|nr:class I SAM-dependent methyltransferase [Pricia sp.]
SQEMLENALQHPKVLYSIHEAEKLKFDNNSFDIITFAGSLYYAKSQKVVDEVVRVSKMGTKVILYDFEILLNDILAKLQFEPGQSNTYNHQEDFSGLQCETMVLVSKKKEKIYLAIEAEQLSHLILSVKEQFIFFRELFMENDVHKALTTKLKNAYSLEKFQIEATIFYSQYHVV